jgi:hypothetical protein
MSHSDDAKRSAGLRDWMVASFVLVVPLMWVGIQARDLPLYMVGAARPAHAAMTPPAAVRHHAMSGGTQAYPLAVAQPR